MAATLDGGVIFEAQSIGMQTLLGIDQKAPRPSDHGNCFGVFVNENVTAEQIVNNSVIEYKIVNFNVENLNALIAQGLTWPIRCMALGPRTAIIHDPRIGERWYSKRYCETCCPVSLLPITQKQARERDILRGVIVEHERFEQINLGKKAEFP